MLWLLYLLLGLGSRDCPMFKIWLNKPLTPLHFQFLTNKYPIYMSMIGTRTFIGQELEIVSNLVQHMTKLCPKNGHRLSRIGELCGQWPRGQAPPLIWEVQLLTNIWPIISQKLNFLEILFCTPSLENVHILSNSSVARWKMKTLMSNICLYLSHVFWQVSRSYIGFAEDKKWSKVGIAIQDKIWS